MAQHYLKKGAVTHLLPYPQTYNETRGSLSADYTFLSGAVERDFLASAPQDYFEKIDMSWTDLATSDMEDVILAWIDLAEEDGWSYYGPDGAEHTIMLNPDQATLEELRYAGVGGAILWECKLSLITDNS